MESKMIGLAISVPFRTWVPKNLSTSTLVCNWCPFVVQIRIEMPAAQFLRRVKDS